MEDLGKFITDHPWYTTRIWYAYLNAVVSLKEGGKYKLEKIKCHLTQEKGKVGNFSRLNGIKFDYNNVQPYDFKDMDFPYIIMFKKRVGKEQFGSDLSFTINKLDILSNSTFCEIITKEFHENLDEKVLFAACPALNEFRTYFADSDFKVIENFFSDEDIYPFREELLRIFEKTKDPLQIRELYKIAMNMNPDFAQMYKKRIGVDKIEALESGNEFGLF